MKTGSAVKAVVFDIGGVLLKTEDHSSRRGLEQKYSLPPRSIEKLVFDSEQSRASTVGQVNIAAVWDSIAKQLSLSPKALEDFIISFWAGDRLDWDLIQFLQDCRPEYTTALLSNAWLGFRQELVDRFSIIEGKTVDHILISSELGVAKPENRIFQILANTVNCGYDEMLFVDDFIENIMAAEALGMKAIHYNPEMDLINEIKSFLGK
jgi:epoxide hydrolase-like predicted phosphatase